jgi:hypothetical protein
LFSGLERSDAETALSEAQAFVAEIARQLKPYIG